MIFSPVPEPSLASRTTAAACLRMSHPCVGCNAYGWAEVAVRPSTCHAHACVCSHACVCMHDAIQLHLRTSLGRSCRSVLLSLAATCQGHPAVQGGFAASCCSWLLTHDVPLLRDLRPCCARVPACRDSYSHDAESELSAAFSEMLTDTSKASRDAVTALNTTVLGAEYAREFTERCACTCAGFAFRQCRQITANPPTRSCFSCGRVVFLVSLWVRTPFQEQPSDQPCLYSLACTQSHAHRPV